MENNKVKVRIYGQEYTIAGERDEETILKVADHVNMKMRELGRNFSSNGQQGTLAVLTALNVADEYFEALSNVERLEETKVKLEKDVQHYIKMWEEAKKSFVQYKENAAKANEEKEKYDERYKDLEARCSEFENSFFDLQMENLQLKSELEKYKRANEI